MRWMKLSGARIASTVMTLIALLHFQPDIFVRKDTGHILVIGSALTVCKRSETEMVKIELEMDKPKECHECPFQLKFKDDVADDWYMRRCVIINQIIEYPLPDWCPIKEV